MTIKVNTSGFGGKTITKVAKAKINDPLKKTIDLTLTGTVESFAEIVPPVVRFNLPVGTAQRQEVRVIPGEKNVFKITGSSAREGKNIRFEVKEITLDTGRTGYLVEVENTKKDAGAYQDMIFLNTDSKKRPQLTIRVHGSIYDESLLEEQKKPDQTRTPDVTH
ncbi:MAG: hypothetical protein AB1724_07495 [Thermodesulfobacteriota bacterium]